jgi:chemotaxis protein MotB
LNRRSRREEEPKENNERWMVTYSDLITLLMIFFIVMYSMSQVDAQKFKFMASSLSQVMGGQSPNILDYNGPSVINGEVQQLEQVHQQVQEYIESNNLGNSIKIYSQERGLVISLKDTMLFSSGQSELSTEAQKIVRKVGISLRGLNNYIRIEGHTDNLPISTSEYRSNWELSTSRATSVLHYLLADPNLSPQKFSATGFGEYRPIASNEKEPGRSLNRRVDIVILKTEYTKAEPIN